MRVAPATSSVVIAASAIRSVAVVSSSLARIAPVRSACRRSLSSLTPGTYPPYSLG